MSFEASFKALSDPVRREILQILKDGRLSAGEISRHFDMTAATVSYHLNILKKAGLVWEEKEKNFIYYDLNTSILEELMSWLIELEGSRKNEE
ncbi:autorepressor SdpR family transcription factor [Tetragenococcus halophilus]|uniref:ArsR family transcriptional regulator n=1 Tax=Tetragenococcus halophilus TaxID=51669 RepID=A0A3G5FFT1_TETHA|nr:autorepressor SdpR family transcription factor [Tetragenococcus halophilus]AYW49169.1 ArsR family transcriptional regulator [Tetragenococcus halophilus]MCO8288204.1 winged helix-turn-helix transcriptional regulator [Tetragenococcus halophilus]MDN6723735.1 autorepressor SdpR family transcription factor [Tetragenococcus halophilus]MDN6726129.1 autorepressor SdpR family transcription factor [Tetragenococcus halophilus]QGP76725.1 autorepressor SdpR family transcription factor [Tetragenococcus h